MKANEILTHDVSLKYSFCSSHSPTNPQFYRSIDIVNFSFKNRKVFSYIESVAVHTTPPVHHRNPKRLILFAKMSNDGGWLNLCTSFTANSVNTARLSSMNRCKLKAAVVIIV